jgi:sodium-coupled neutral amino acid transporter 11
MSESQKLLYERHDESDSDPGHDIQPFPARRRPSPAAGVSRSRSRQSSASPAPGAEPNGRFGPPKRQSSFAQPRPDGAPRTPLRVRFEEPRRSMNGDAQGGEWMELEGDDFLEAGDEGRERVQRLPLLTGIEAPSVTVAAEAFHAEDHLESARPRSSMRSAFMNMANSIM